LAPHISIMRISFVFLTVLSLSLSQRTRARVFILEDQWRGDDFFRDWNWETENDPTHGRVNYVGQAEAISKNLAYTPDGYKFIMRADSRFVVNPSARGRDSIRISSQNAYDEAIIVLDLSHMPAGCATWPAFWTLSQAGPWPNGGEIDIIEGVNLNTQNQATLHTTPGCTIAPQGANRTQTGTSTSNDCNAFVNFNQGCGVLFSNSGPSYGAPFNLNGGGYYVMSKTRDSGIKIWFWRRGDHTVPPEISHGPTWRGGVLIDLPNPSWGDPAAYFPLDPGHCNYNQYFNAHVMVFDLTFCGDWAGKTWGSSGCGTGTCENLVNNFPTAFSEAYWEINSLRVYTPLFSATGSSDVFKIQIPTP